MKIMEDGPSSSPTSSSSCMELALAAFDAHPHCYVEAGVCTSVVKSCDNFLRVIELLEFSDLLGSARVGFRIAAKQVYSTYSLVK